MQWQRYIVQRSVQSNRCLKSWYSMNYLYLLRTTGFFVIAIAFIGFLQTNWTDHHTTTDTCIIDFIAAPMLTIFHSTHILYYGYSIYGIWLWIVMTG